MEIVKIIISILWVPVVYFIGKYAGKSEKENEKGKKDNGRKRSSKNNSR